MAAIIHAKRRPLPGGAGGVAVMLTKATHAETKINFPMSQILHC